MPELPPIESLLLVAGLLLLASILASKASGRLGVPALLCLDGPRGVGFDYKATSFPVSECRAATWDPSVEEAVGEAAGYETRAFKANMLLAPCINLVWHPRWGRSQESYGEDPVLLGAMGRAFVRGLQKHAMACVKHYAVNNTEINRTKVNAVADERLMRGGLVVRGSARMSTKTWQLYDLQLTLPKLLDNHALIDLTADFAIAAKLGRGVPTVDMRVDYLRPATAEVYTIRARVVRLGRTLATVDAEVEAADGQKVACGRAVLQNIAQMTGK